jgi:hypothetical protein
LTIPPRTPHRTAKRAEGKATGVARSAFIGSVLLYMPVNIFRRVT